jgi:hypothetical protein
MSDWTLTDLPLGEGAYGIAGYGVLDALGVKIGYISGWVKDPDERVRMLKVAVREWFDMKEYLIPVGSITLVDDDRSQIQLRELTKRTIPKYCMPYEDDLPEPQLLKSLIRFFPNPRPTVAERLAKPEEAPVRRTARLSVHQDQGDGSGSVLEPAFLPGPNWIRLRELIPPSWTPLDVISVEMGR